MLKVSAVVAVVGLALVAGAFALVRLGVIPADSLGLLGAVVGTAVGGGIAFLIRQRAAAARGNKMPVRSSVQAEKL